MATNEAHRDRFIEGQGKAKGSSMALDDPVALHWQRS